jgi:hypothetical protein
MASLAHALMEQIALECGYPLSSLKERVYAFAGPRPDVPDRFGLLIYTASAGAQGTLGGLVEIADRIPEILNSALERMRLCSNDPVCADHDPSVAGDERSLHGAACHACLLVPETSCEARNVYLDRALLVENRSQRGVRRMRGAVATRGRSHADSPAMDDMFAEAVTLALPPRLSLQGRILNNRIEQLLEPAAQIRCRLQPFSTKRVSGFVTNLSSSARLYVISRKTTTDLGDGPVLYVPGAQSAADIATALANGLGSWRSPTPRQSNHRKPHHRRDNRRRACRYPAGYSKA